MGNWPTKLASCVAFAKFPHNPVFCLVPAGGSIHFRLRRSRHVCHGCIIKKNLSLPCDELEKEWITHTIKITKSIGILTGREAQRHVISINDMIKIGGCPSHDGSIPPMIRSWLFTTCDVCEYLDFKRKDFQWDQYLIIQINFTNFKNQTSMIFLILEFHIFLLIS